MYRWDTGVYRWDTGVYRWDTGVYRWDTGVYRWDTGVYRWDTGCSPCQNDPCPSSRSWYRRDSRSVSLLLSTMM
jgi:hypothetical protein